MTSQKDSSREVVFRREIIERPMKIGVKYLEKDAILEVPIGVTISCKITLTPPM
jgi:hypothetical protein